MCYPETESEMTGGRHREVLSHSSIHSTSVKEFLFLMLFLFILFLYYLHSLFKKRGFINPIDTWVVKTLRR